MVNGCPGEISGGRRTLGRRPGRCVCVGKRVRAADERGQRHARGRRLPRGGARAAGRDARGARRLLPGLPRARGGLPPLRRLPRPGRGRRPSCCIRSTMTRPPTSPTARCRIMPTSALLTDPWTAVAARAHLQGARPRSMAADGAHLSACRAVPHCACQSRRVDVRRACTTAKGSARERLISTRTDELRCRARSGAAPKGVFWFWPEDAIQELARALISGRGEASGVAIARQLLVRCAAQCGEQSGTFYRFLADEMQPDRPRRRSCECLRDSPRGTLAAPAESGRKPAPGILRRLNLAPGATAEIVTMRRDLLRSLRR